MRFERKNDDQRRAAAIKAAATQRNRLIFMSALLVMVVIALFASDAQRRRLQEGDGSKLPAGAPTEVVALPPFDRTALDELVRDGRPEERVLSEPEALDLLLSYVSLLTPSHFAELGLFDLNPAAAESMSADPSGHRAGAYRVRGYVETITERRRNALAENAPGRTEYHGTLRLEDERAVHFVVLEAPEKATIDSFLRIDGLFLKMYSLEGEDGWIEAPLLVGKRAVRSYPSLTLGSEPGEAPEYLLATVVDDVNSPTEGIQPVPPPHEARWALMAYARDLPPDSIDWEAAPVLDNELMTQLLRDGRAYRGTPVRFPIVQLQDA